MAGGNIVGVEDLGGERYRVNLANGTSPTFTGKAGRSAYEDFLKRQESAVGPNATAESGFAKGAIGGIVNSIPVVGPLAGAAASRLLDKKATATDAPASASPAPAAEPPARQGVTTVEPPQAQPQAAGPHPPQPNPSGPTMLPYAAKGIGPDGKEVTGRAVMMPDGSMMVMQQGSRGSPGGMTALGKQIYQGRIDANEAAAPLEQKAAEAREAGVGLAIQQNEAQKAYLEEQRTQAMLRAQNERDEALAAERHVSELQARADAAAEEYASSRMPEDSAADKFFQGLGATLGAIGASLARTPNFAQEFIQQLKNNKIRKWEAEVNIKGAKANNLLARYKDALGDMKLAKAAVGETLMRQAAIEAEQMGLSTKSEQIGNTWREMSNAAGAAGIRASQEKNEAFLLSFYGNKMLNAPAVAGRAGGLVPATQAAYGEAQSQSVQLAKLAAEKAAAERGGQKDSAVESGRTEKIAGFAQGIQAAQNVMDELKKRGVTKDPYDDPTAGAIDRLSNSQSNDTISQNTQVLAKGLQSAFGKSDRDAEDALKMAEGGGSGRARAQAAQAAQARMVNNLRAEIGTLPDAQKVKILQQLPPEVRAKVLAQ